MTTEILRVEYRYIILDDQMAAAAALETLGDLGIELMGFSEFPYGAAKSQMNLIAENSEKLARTALDMGLALSRPKTGFLIRGSGQPGVVVADVLKRLGGAHIDVTSLHAVAARAGCCGALLWVKAPDVEEAAKVLGATPAPRDPVDETSEESFPASDPPSWAMARSK